VGAGDEVQHLISFIVSSDISDTSFDSNLSRKLGMQLKETVPSSLQVKRSSKTRLPDGSTVVSGEVRRLPGRPAQVILEFGDEPCINATLLAKHYGATATSEGSLPSPGPMNAPPERTFTTGAYAATTGAHKLIVGYKRWVPDNVQCVSSIVVEQ
jgi:hypothetical protein